MAGFATEADLAAALDAQTVLWRPWAKTFANSDVTGNWCSAWPNGIIPPAGATPATTPGTSYTNDPGGVTFPDLDPIRKFLVFHDWVPRSLNTTQNVLIVDRLVAVSGISLSTTGDKTVSSVALPRYTDGIGVWAMLEITTAPSTTAPTISLNSYTDQDGNTGQVGGSISGTAVSNVAGTILGPFPLAAGDTGVKAVSTVNVSVASATGVANLILVKPLVGLGSTNQAIPSERQRPHDYVRLFDGATLMFIAKVGGTGTPTGQGSIGVVYG